MYPLIFITTTTTIVLLSNPIGIGAQLRPCSTEDAYCQIEGDNLQGVISEAQNLTECLETANEAAFVSYFGPLGFPFVDSCLYFSSCDILNPCENCTTQDLSSYCITYCSAPIEGTVGANLISVIGDVSDESTCKQMCQEEAPCSVYTYHWANSTSSPKTCFLLTNIGSPVRECADNSCATGLPDCEGSAPICSYLDDGGTIQEGGVNVTVGEGEKNIALLRLGECPAPVALAIGPGGEGPYAGGGGGSGYVAHTVDLPAGAYVKMTAFAGDRSASYVKDLDTDSVIVEGEMGGDGERTSTGVTTADGGAGYSGGGGYCFDGLTNAGGNGGSNGRDGGGTAACGTSAGGEGSVLDVATIPLRNFKLGPGDGGNWVGMPGGGGGGGVLVDDTGPERPDFQTGEGFGGGGYQKSYGLPGAVLLDFVPEE